MSRWVERVVNLKPGEGRLALLGAAQFFLLLFGYFMLRPLREAMGLVGGVDELSTLYLINVGVMLVLNVAFGAVVSRAAKRRLTVIVYRFAIACLLVFTVLLSRNGGEPSALVGKVFYVWLSVFNVFVVSLFWSLMADLQAPEQSKRLFGMVAVGGTLGAIAGSAWAWQLVEAIGATGMFVSAIVLLELAARVSMLHREPVRSREEPERIGGAAWAGLTHLLRSPYFLAIALYTLMHTGVSTFVYFEKMTIVEAAAEGAASRAELFAMITLGGQILTVAMQVFLTGRLMKLVGVGTLMSIVPLVSLGGFFALEAGGMLVTIAVFESVRNASHYALGKPARETLFTVVSTEDKYKAKAAIDTFVYRGGDAASALTRQAVVAASWPVLWVVVPMGVVGMATAGWLGRRERAKERRGDEPSAAPAGAAVGTSLSWGAEDR